MTQTIIGLEKVIEGDTGKGSASWVGSRSLGLALDPDSDITAQYREQYSGSEGYVSERQCSSDCPQNFANSVGCSSRSPAELVECLLQKEGKDLIRQVRLLLEEDGSTSEPSCLLPLESVDFWLLFPAEKRDHFLHSQ